MTRSARAQLFASLSGSRLQSDGLQLIGGGDFCCRPGYYVRERQGITGGVGKD